MKKKEIQVIEKFILDFEHLVKELENYSSYLQLGDATEELKDEAIRILKKKLKKMKKAESKDDLKKVIRLKKLLEKSGLR
jgi:hypothetical protein